MKKCLLCRRLVLALASSHHQALSKNKERRKCAISDRDFYPKLQFSSFSEITFVRGYGSKPEPKLLACKIKIWRWLCVVDID